METVEGNERGKIGRGKRRGDEKKMRGKEDLGIEEERRGEERKKNTVWPTSSSDGAGEQSASSSNDAVDH